MKPLGTSQILPTDPMPTSIIVRYRFHVWSNESPTPSNWAIFLRLELVSKKPMVPLLVAPRPTPSKPAHTQSRPTHDPPKPPKYPCQLPNHRIHYDQIGLHLLSPRRQILQVGTLSAPQWQDRSRRNLSPLVVESKKKEGRFSSCHWAPKPNPRTNPTYDGYPHLNDVHRSQRGSCWLERKRGIIACELSGCLEPDNVEGRWPWSSEETQRGLQTKLAFVGFVSWVCFVGWNPPEPTFWVLSFYPLEIMGLKRGMWGLSGSSASTLDGPSTIETFVTLHSPSSPRNNCSLRINAPYPNPPYFVHIPRFPYL